ncbi:L-type lectin-domain containing receptor kinase SIT2-like [Curcuma longa]|uniref:L-type lectin-domain containing receptor kinase SIT2-like n=1 Tax=Curcuma longa TaxID=136217 RepID=UPI003D9F5006
MWRSTFLCFLLFLFLHHHLSAGVTTGSGDDFTLNGFREANLTLDGTATITSNGLLRLTNNTRQMRGHAFHQSQIQFRPPRHNGTVFSFSTTFVFATILKDQYIGGNGLTFLISGSDNFSSALGSQFLGLFNPNSTGNSTNHVFAIELDTIFNPELHDINGNHVGIDVNGVVSNFSFPAGYYSDDTGVFQNLSLLGEQVMQAWVEYDAESMRLNVTLAPVPLAKPRRPLISRAIDLSPVFLDSMFVGFSASTGSYRTAHYVLGWSFKINGTARALDYSLLPSLPRTKSGGRSKLLEVGIPLASAGVVLAIAGVVALVVRRRMKYAELLEDWEREYGPHRFSYKDLFDATGGFAEENSLGDGGFGRVYRGVLPVTKLDVAVKRVSHESRQGMREFVAEIVSLGRLRHRNLVRLLGYCRRKGELLLVYDYMPNGSLDKLLYDRLRPCLDWPTRFKIIKGVASGLLYLHEDWEQMVIHRDIKASNVLLDSEMNGRLGDFGLARLYDHGNDPQTTHIVGTMGYIAPELVRTGRASAATDVFAFGTFLFEVACGRRPVDWAADIDKLELLEWVLESWRKGSILETKDARLGEEFVAEEVELVLKLGLLCVHPLPAARPSMSRVVEYLDGSSPLPELTATYLSFKTIALQHSKSFEDYMTSYPSSSSVATTSSIAGAQ